METRNGSDLAFNGYAIFAIELWMWLGKDPGAAFRPSRKCGLSGKWMWKKGSPSSNSSDRLAAQVPVIGEKVFDLKAGNLLPNLSVIVTQDGVVVSPFDVEEKRNKRWLQNYRFAALCGGYKNSDPEV